MAVDEPAGGSSLPGLETWETLHARQQDLQLRREQFDQKLEDVAAETAIEPWETQLDESWPDMQARLERDLRANPLDNENKPFSEISGGRSLIDRKTSDGKPTNIVWQAGPNPDDEGENIKQNSDHMMASLKHWALEPPNMALLVYGGSMHPWQLIQIQRMQDQRADFLQSRPRFNDTYFDGQRDPAKGWMAVGNAWRYPAFYTSPAYKPPAFTFRPSHTLFVDAALQVQEDHELMERGDFTINEWIMDAVTHQPIARQPAIKGMDDVFYWDLGAAPLRAGGNVTPLDVDLRKRYLEWARGVRTQQLKQGKGGDPGYPGGSKFLMGSTKRMAIDRWGSMTARLLLHEKQKKKIADDNRLVEGEIRLEFTSLKLYKSGLARLNSLMPPPAKSIANAMSSTMTMGTMTMSAMSGEVFAVQELERTRLVLIKVMIPGDPDLVSDPVRMSRGPMPRQVKLSGLSRRAYYHKGVGNDPEMAARSVYFHEILASKNPIDSLLKISVLLADDTGAEIEDAEIATFEYSLKELIQDIPSDDYGTHQIIGDVEVFAHPPAKERRGGRARVSAVSPAVSSPSRAAAAETPPSRPSFLSRSKTLSSLSSVIDAASSSAPRTPNPLERPVAMGKISGRIAIRPIKEPVATEADSAAAKLHSKVVSLSQGKKNWRKASTIVPVVESDGAPAAAAALSAGRIRASPALDVEEVPLPVPLAMPLSADPAARLPELPSRAADGDEHAETGEAGADPELGLFASRSPFPPSAAAPATHSPSPPPPPPPGDDLVAMDVQTPPPSPPQTPPDDDDDGGDGDGDGGGPQESSNLALLTGAIKHTGEQKHTLVFTVAYWIKWRTVDSIGDQRLLFGDATNQPMLVRGNRLGALVNNYFCATEYDPRWNGDNWQLAVVTCDGMYSRFYVGFSSTDESGHPEAARAEDPLPGRPISDVKTEISGDAALRRLSTAGQGAGWVAQAWIWPRDLQPDEVRELWMNTKGRYPVARRGLPSGGLLAGGTYRPPPNNPFGDSTPVSKPAAAGGAAESTETPQLALRSTRKLPPVAPPPGPGGNHPLAQPQTKAVAAKLIDREMSAMLEVPLVNQLAFQRLLNVFSVLVEYAINSKSYIVIDRIHNFSCTAELMLELALRKNPTSTPPVLVLDSKTRLVKANHKLKQLKRANFLEKGVKVTSIDFLNASLRQLVTPAGLSWLRASSSDLASVVQELARRPEEGRRLDAQRVKEIYEMYGEEGDVRRDGRPRIEHIWKCFYAASLFASGTHYIIFDQIDMKGRSVLETLGPRGSIFMSGSSFEHRKIKECIQKGSPVLLLQSTGGVTQAFAHAMKAVRLLKSSWPVDKVLRLVTEYKLRAADDPMQPQASKRLMIEHVQYLDKELARIDLLLSSEEHAEAWMRAFGLPEILLLFEMWQRAPTFLMRQIQMADVMKKSAEALLSIFTDTFSNGASAAPELGLGSAETKVVATAWNRHLLLFHNGDKYNVRSWTTQLILYCLAVATTVLAVISITNEALGGDKQLTAIMLILPIISALLGTISTRLRMREKFAQCKMASFEIVSEIYKYRVRAIEYDQLALAAAEAAKESAGKDKKKDDEEPAKPISAEKLGKICRKSFVKRIQFIYTKCMMSELSTGTSITHTTRVGLDPARLLRDFEAAGEPPEDLRMALQTHVAEKLYFLKSLEWEKGVDGYKEYMTRRWNRQLKQIKRVLRSRARACVFAILGVFVGCLVSLERAVMRAHARYKHRQAVRRGDVPEETKDRFRIKYGSDEANAEEGGGGGGGGGGAAASKPAAKLTMLQRLSASMRSTHVMTSTEDTANEPDESLVDKLELNYRVVDDDDDEGEAAEEGEAGGGRAGDTLFGPLNIEDYVRYRARPICTYLERTAPWRAFELQFLEILVFFFNSLGAVMVGLGSAFVPWVTVTVAFAAALKSFTDFANLSKQVESYNAALRDVHNLMNDWDSKTSTERRTHQAITQMVSTVENSLQLVAMALTDAQPSSMGSQEGEDGDGEGGDEKDK